MIVIIKKYYYYSDHYYSCSCYKLLISCNSKWIVCFTFLNKIYIYTIIIILFFCKLNKCIWNKIIISLLSCYYYIIYILIGSIFYKNMKTSINHSIFKPFPCLELRNKTIETIFKNNFITKATTYSKFNFNILVLIGGLILSLILSKDKIYRNVLYYCYIILYDFNRNSFVLRVINKVFISKKIKYNIQLLYILYYICVNKIYYLL
jgi:hypothetical protein